MFSSSANHSQRVALVSPDIGDFSNLHSDLYPTARRADAANAFFPPKISVLFLTWHVFPLLLIVDGFR